MFSLTSDSTAAITAADPSIDTTTVVVTVTGTNDTPEITINAGNDTGSTTEDLNTVSINAAEFLQDTGTISFNDVDLANTGLLSTSFISATATTALPSRTSSIQHSKISPPLSHSQVMASLKLLAQVQLIGPSPSITLSPNTSLLVNPSPPPTASHSPTTQKLIPPAAAMSSMPQPKTLSSPSPAPTTRQPSPPLPPPSQKTIPATSSISSLMPATDTDASDSLSVTNYSASAVDQSNNPILSLPAP